MSQSNVLINSFNTGEVGPLIESRSDIAKYASACKTLENATPLVEGGAKKRPGTYFAGATALGGAMFTGSISATTLTVTSMNYGVLQVGQPLVAPGLIANTFISALGTGKGGAGTYTVNNSQTVASETMQVPSTGKSRLVPFQFSTIQGAILELSGGLIRIWEGASQGEWSLGLALQFPANAGGTTIYSIAGATATATATGTTNTTTVGSSGFPSTVISGNLAVSLNISLNGTVPPAAGSGGGGGASFQWSLDGTHWTQYASLGLSATGSLSQNINFTISGVTNLNTLQFQVVVNAGSGGATPPTVSMTGTYSAPIVSYTSSASSNYNPATSYVFGNVVSVGPFATAMFAGGSPAGMLSIGSPYGTSNASTVPITFTVNGSDALAVTVVGVSPNQGINIALANATHAHNAATAIQAAIQALVSLNSKVNNFVDLSQWIVTPDTVYFATPWILAPGPAAWVNQNFVAACVVANVNDEFPVNQTGQFNAAYWQNASLVEQPIQLATPYSEDDLFALDCSTQSADVLWIFHANYPPAVVERLTANSWSYSTSLPGQQPGEPPYRGTLGLVKTGYTGIGMSITAITQAYPAVITVVADTVLPAGSRVYVNEVAGMVELNQGEFLVDAQTLNADGTLSFQIGSPDGLPGIDSTGYQAYVSGGFAVQVVPFFAAAGDYPACGTLYQQRLCVGGSNNNPTQINGSVEDDFPDFIADPNEADFAFQFTLVSNKLNQALNMIGTPNALLIGTAGGVWVMTGSNGESLGPTNVDAELQTSMGVSGLQPQLVNSSAVFVSRSARIVTFLVFDFASNQWETIDLTRLNRSITLGSSEQTSGIGQTAFQMEPYPIYWGFRNDGQLIGLVFNTQDQVYAWFRVTMTPGIIESVAVISGQGQEDQIAVVVQRQTNGVTQRYVEYFMPQELFGQLTNAFFVDCGQQFQGVGPFNITGITNANPAVVTAPGHTLQNGQTIAVADVLGMDQANTNPLIAWTVAGVSGDTFQLQGIDSTGWGVYTSGGTVEQVTNQVTGMSYLLGQSVVAVGDGAQILQPTVVTADTVAFPSYANTITIGLPFTTTIEPMNPIIGNAQDTSKGKKQKFNGVTLSLYQSIGGKVGTDLNQLHSIIYPAKYQDSPPPLFTGNLTRDLDADWEYENTIVIVHSDPYPFTLRSVTPTLNVGG